MDLCSNLIPKRRWGESSTLGKATR
ncbi:hypothetical protein LINPERPRIM_LOCUS15394 [Linum perenne]